ncbi:hypothetical protein J2Y45_005819 [Dyadobacter sp. BE34]|uniref:Lipoprotein n=1 Tax=Dyadobacter fermentans TaxID=94254 RepID=A0ABU1R5W2_9BACT|nr:MULTISPECIES: hypothetical protein [Dyadobacter]MDR6808607.1 hypothetical protein [Dyadobacter fermentans]MDR7046350.1 hypothetical protein [Dyadobacter sp. BE242]MDR7200663.1 hypothetical protein [Dyadobacter sp. BE34]MDR7218623.1 hypothetical protein [Dyadobacter sp. BE31]MDR7266553.1 hypothetical protein [Dyadobacter sp. BE32]
MTLIQKFPLGLALATCMIMSSCSKDDVQVAQPEKVASGFNNERGGGLQGLPTIPTTDGTAGINMLVADWSFSQQGNPVEVGTSTKTHLWGDSNFPWTKPFLNPPGANNNNPNNFVTIMSQENVLANDDKITTSFATAKIKHLKPGKKYALTVSVASSICIRNGEPTVYSPAPVFKSRERLVKIWEAA